MKKITTIIFDMDGVLILSESFNRRLHEEIFTEHNLPLTDEEYARFFVGRRYADAYANYFAHKNGERDDAIRLGEKFLAKKSSVLEESNLEDSVPLRDGTKEMLERLRPQFHLAVGTSAHRLFVPRILDGLDIRKYFEVVIMGGDVSRGKPEPDVYLAVAHRMNVQPSECVVIEDAANGIAAAKNAGMRCIAIRDAAHGERDLSQADHIIDHFNQLTLELISKI